MVGSSFGLSSCDRTKPSVMQGVGVSAQVHEILHCCFTPENRLTLRQNVALPRLGSQERSSVPFPAAAREATEVLR